MWQQLQCKPLHRPHRPCMASSRDLASQNDPLNLLLVLKVLVVTAKTLPCYVPVMGILALTSVRSGQDYNKDLNIFFTE